MSYDFGSFNKSGMIFLCKMPKRNVGICEKIRGPLTDEAVRGILLERITGKSAGKQVWEWKKIAGCVRADAAQIVPKLVVAAAQARRQRWPGLRSICGRSLASAERGAAERCSFPAVSWGACSAKIGRSAGETLG